jgi:hypothetical protein
MLRLEQFPKDVAEFNDLVQKGGAGKKCTMERSNEGSGKPGASTAALRKHLADSPLLMRKLCLLLFQEIHCFGYQLPEACKPAVDGWWGDSMEQVQTPAAQQELTPEEEFWLEEEKRELEEEQRRLADEEVLRQRKAAKRKARMEAAKREDSELR